MKRNFFRSLVTKLSSLDTAKVIGSGFLASYLLFFLRRTFFASETMLFFQYVPSEAVIGVDLKRTLFYSKTWLVDALSPYVGANLYPPLTSVIFAPLTAISFSLVYKIITLTSLFSCLLVTLLLSHQTAEDKRISPMVMLVLTTGLFSYGFQFEIERGQFNLIAVSICYFAIWIYYVHDRYRILAYVLFSISVQLKVFPFIFLLMFLVHHQTWQEQLKKIATLGGVNFLLLFILGPSIFVDFIKAIKVQTAHPYIWVGNHSIHSFTTSAVQALAKTSSAEVLQYSDLIKFSLAAITLGCIALIFHCSHKKNGAKSNLLLACALGALLLSSPSHDYKLSTLITPVAFFFSEWVSIICNEQVRIYTNITRLLLLFVFSAAYSSTLFSFTNKPQFLDNNLPAIFAMLLSIAILSFILPRSPDGQRLPA